MSCILHILSLTLNGSAEHCVKRLLSVLLLPYAKKIVEGRVMSVKHSYA